MNPHRVKRYDPIRTWHVLEREAFGTDTASGFFETLNTYQEVLKEYQPMSIIADYKRITFSDSDVVNPDDFIPHGEHNPHNVRPFLMHDHGFVVAVVFADCLQDALDEAANKSKLDRYQVEDVKVDDNNCEGFTILGNAGERFDIESLEVIELPNPKFSFVTLFNAM